MEAADGNRLRAFTATAIDPEAAGIVILPDVRGLHPFYEHLAARFAEVGVHATAIDYFGRTAGIDDRDENFDHAPHLDHLSMEGLAADAAAGVAHVRSDAGGGATRVFTVGFCMGGWISFNQAADHADLDGVIGFYGRLRGMSPEDDRAPIKLAPSYRCPVLGLFGGADAGIPLEEVDRFRGALTGAGVANEIVAYEGAPHSFFDVKFEQHADACDDAWLRIRAFVRPA